MGANSSPGRFVATPTQRIRYPSDLPYFKSSPTIYNVIRTDQHYFEVAARTDETGDADRKLIKYMDVGYHISLEIWSGRNPFVNTDEKGTGKKKPELK